MYSVSCLSALLILFPCRNSCSTKGDVDIFLEIDKSYNALTSEIPAGPIREFSSSSRGEEIGPTIHIMFTIVDHWEPGDGPDALRRARLWSENYRTTARKHRDANNYSPQHTWFCAYLDPPSLREIARATFDGLGEMEVHIHHGSDNDDSVDNTAEMSATLDRFTRTLAQFGACWTSEKIPTTRFGFIHGMWALDNSRLVENHRQYCGVNREIDLLIKKGCYADFTFPAWGAMNPPVFGDFLLTRDSDEPKSYEKRENVRLLSVKGEPPRSDELLLFQGPPANTNIDHEDLPTLDRFQEWVTKRVSVSGQPYWIFVKCFTHGSQTFDHPAGVSALTGQVADEFFSEIESAYNDGRYRQLHYVNAREAYNIALAAADGKSGDPHLYRNYKIPPPVNRYLYCSTTHLVRRFETQPLRIDVEIVEMTDEIEFRLKHKADDIAILEADIAEGPYTGGGSAHLKTGNGYVRLIDDSPSRFYRFVE